MNISKKILTLFLIIIMIISNITVLAENAVVEITNGEERLSEIEQIQENLSIELIREKRSFSETENEKANSDTGVLKIGNSAKIKLTAEISENANETFNLSSVTKNDYLAIGSPSFENAINHPHLGGRNVSEYVSPFDGSLQLNFNDISLPGRNGLDLNLNRFFKNTTADNKNYRGYNGVLQSEGTTYFNERYALGLGWSFGFPSVELTRTSTGDMQAYYHDGTGSVYRSNYNDSVKDEDGNEYYNGNLVYGSNLDNYYTDAVKFKERDSSYSRGEYRSKYSFKTADNTMQYFGKFGELLSIKDRFGNEITFDYENISGENIIPFMTHRDFNYGTSWYSEKGYFGYDSTSKRSTEMSTYFVELDERYSEYHFSVGYYVVEDAFDPFEGTFSVYCDLYDGSELIESIPLNNDVSPTVIGERVYIEQSFNIDDYTNLTPTKAKIRIAMNSAENEIQFGDLRLSPKRPLISKITDTVGRQILFDYFGDLYIGYENTPSFDINVTVLDSNNEIINEFYYDRSYSESSIYANDDIIEKNRMFLFYGCSNGEKSSFVEYEIVEGSASSGYYNDDIYYAFDFGKFEISRVINLNSSTYFEYEKARKWIDNRPARSTVSAGAYNTSFRDTWRVVKKYDNLAKNTLPENGKIVNQTSYNYTSGAYEDETGYYWKTYSGMEPGLIDPEIGSYIVKITHPNGSIESYEYTTHTFDTSFRSRWEISLPLLDSKTVTESADNNADSIRTDHTYNDNYAVTSPSITKTTETIDGISREYYNKYEYDETSCYPVKTSLPLTEEEASSEEIPVKKAVTTEYYSLSGNLFLPKNTQYYQNEDGTKVTTSIQRDSLGRVVSETNAENETVYYEYHSDYLWLPIKTYFFDPQNRGEKNRSSELIYEYTDNLLLKPNIIRTKISENKYSETQIEYEPFYGNKSLVIDSSGNKTEYTYDKFGRVLTVKYPPYKSSSGDKQIVDEYSYDSRRKYDSEIYCSSINLYRNMYAYPDTLGIPEVEWVYYEEILFDDYGNILRKYDVHGTQEYIYDDALRVIVFKDYYRHNFDENTLTYEYDGFNRILSVTDIQGNKQQADYKSLSTEYEFIPYGSSISENHYTENYDMYGNMVSASIYPTGRNNEAITTSYNYDLVGNVLKQTDANGKITSFVYDKLNNPIRIINADGSITDTEYSKSGEAVSVKQYKGEDEFTWSSFYDDRGLLTSTEQKGVDIYSKPWYYSYNEDGKLDKTVMPNGIANQFAYDNSGNLISSKTNNEEYEYTYNYYGEIETLNYIKNGSTVETRNYVYNSEGFLEIESRDGINCEYIYDYLNLPGSIKWYEESPDSADISYYYIYDSLHRVTSISDSPYNEYTYVYEYYDDNLIKSLTYPKEALKTEYTYDNANRLQTITTKYNDTVLKTYSYTYDNVGNILSVSGSENVTYTYDDLYRLKTYTKDGVTTTYEYDSRNNIISETRPNYEKTYEYGGDNRLYSVTENGETVTYKYDLNGNLISDSEGNEYAYDEKNRLIYSKVNGKVTEYEIGADGLRKSKTTNGITTDYLVDRNGNVIREDEREDITWGNKPLAKSCYSGQGIFGDIYRDYYYVYNGHGDVVAMVDYNGNIVNEYSYDPWGKITSETETVDNPIKYAGEYYDDESGLIYLRNRYYNPSIGRFISEDPARDELNWYAYCGNNPVMFVDPLGNVPVETIFDLASIGWSFYEFVNNPSLINFGFLAWDVAAALVPYAPGSYAAKTLKAGTQILSKSDNYVKSGVWAMKAFDRGYEIEKALGGWANNFPVIDWAYKTIRGDKVYLETIKSIKSIDITASSYQSASKLKNKLKGYIDDLAKYTGTDKWQGKTYKVIENTSRTLEVAIPPVEMTSSQAEAFTEMVEYAKGKGVTFITRIVK